MVVVVGLHEQACHQEDEGSEHEESRVLERCEQSLAYTLALLQLLKVKVGEWDPEEAKASNNTVGSYKGCTRVEKKKETTASEVRIRSKTTPFSVDSARLSACLISFDTTMRAATEYARDTD